MEEDGEDSDASDCLIIDDDRIDREEPANAKRPKLNAFDDQSKNTEDNIVNNEINEMRTLINQTPPINYVALMKNTNLKAISCNIPFISKKDATDETININDTRRNGRDENQIRISCKDFSRIPFDDFSNFNGLRDNPIISDNTTRGNQQNYVDARHEQIQNKEKILTYKDFGLIPIDDVSSMNQIRENSALYACLTENNTTNLTLTNTPIKPVKYTGIPLSTDAFGGIVNDTDNMTLLRGSIYEGNTSNPSIPPVEALNYSGMPLMSAPNFTPVAVNQRADAQSVSLRANSEIQANSRTVTTIPPAMNVQGVADRNISTRISDALGSEGQNQAIMSNPGLLDPVHGAEPLNTHRLNGTTNAPKVMSMNSYGSVAYHVQSQGMHINLDASGRHMHGHKTYHGPPIVMNPYIQRRQPQAICGYACCSGPQGQMAIGATRIPLSTPHNPGIQPNTYVYYNNERPGASLNPTAQTGVPIIPNSYNNQCNSYGQAYGYLPPDPVYRDNRGQNQGNTVAYTQAFSAAMSRNSYILPMSTEATHHLVNASGSTANPNPAKQLTTKTRKETAKERKIRQSRLPSSSLHSDTSISNGTVSGNTTIQNWDVLGTDVTKSKRPTKATTKMLKAKTKIAGNFSCFQVPLSSVPNLQPTRTNTRIGIMPADVRTIPYNMSNATNGIEGPLSTKAHLQPTRMNTSIETAQADIRTTAYNMSNTTNRIQTPLSLETHLQPTGMDVSIGVTHANIGTVASMSNINNRQVPLNSEHHLQSTRMNISVEEAIAKIKTTANNVSNITNEIQTPSSAVTHLQSTRSNMNIVAAQAELKTAAYNMSNTSIGVHTPLSTEAHLQSTRLNMSVEAARANSNTTAYNMSMVTNGIQAQLSTEAHLQSTIINTSVEAAQANTAAFNTSSITNGIQAHLSTQAHVQSMKMNMSAVQDNTKTTAYNMTNITNGMQAKINTESLLQSTSMNMDVETAHTKIKQIICDKSNSTKKGQFQSTSMNMTNSEAQAAMAMKICTQQVKMSMDINGETLPTPINTELTEINLNGERAQDLLSDEVFAHQAGLNNNAVAAQVDMRMQTSVQQAKMDERVEVPEKANIPQNSINRNIESPLDPLNGNRESANNNVIQTPRAFVNSRSNAYQVKVSTTTTTSEAVTHDIASNEFVPRSTNFTTEEALSKNDQRTDSTFNTMDHRIERKVTVEVVNHISIQTDILKAILDNVNRNSALQDQNTSPAADVGANKANNDHANIKNFNCNDDINKRNENATAGLEPTGKDAGDPNLTDVYKGSLENKDVTVSKCQNEAIMDHKSNYIIRNGIDDNLEAARKRLARLSALQKEGKDVPSYRIEDNTQRDTNTDYNVKLSVGQSGEYIIQIVPSCDLSSVGHTESHVNKSKDCGEMNKEINTIKTNNPRFNFNTDKDQKNTNNRNIMDQNARKRNIENDPEISEGNSSRKVRKKSKKHRKKKLGEQKASDNLQQTADMNMADIEQGTNAATELQQASENAESYTENIEEGINERRDEVDCSIDETSFFIFQLNFFRRVQEGHSDNYRVELANELSDDIYNLIDISDDEGAKADMKYKCHVCRNVAVYSPRQLFCKGVAHYLENYDKIVQNCQTCIAFRKKYIQALNKYIESLNEKVDTEKNQNSARTDAVTNNSVKQRPTHSDTSCHSEGGDTTNKQNNDYDAIEEQLRLITNGGTPTPIEGNMADQEKHNTGNSDECRNTQNAETNNFVVKLPRIKLKKSIIESLIKAKNNKCNENKLAIVANNKNKNSNITEKDRNIEKSIIVDTVSYNINVINPKLNDNNHNHTERGLEVTEMSSGLITTSIIAKSKSKDINTAANSNDNNKERGKEVRKSISTVTATTNIEQCNRKTNSVSKNDKIKIKKITDKNTEIIISKTNNDNIRDKHKERHRKGRNSLSETTTGTQVEKNTKEDHEIRRNISTTTVARTNAEPRSLNIDAASNNNNNNDKNKQKDRESRKTISIDPANRNTNTASNNNDNDKNKEITRKERTSISNETATARNTKSLSQNNNTPNNKDNNIERNRNLRKSISTENITVNNGNKNFQTNTRNTSAIPPRTENVAQSKETEADRANNGDIINNNHGTDSKGSGEDNDREYDANQTVTKALENAFKSLKKNCNSPDLTELPQVTITGKKSKDRRVGKKTVISYEYTCHVCYSKFKYPPYYLRHMCQHGVTDGKIPEDYTSIKCAFCTRYIESNLYNAHVKHEHKDIYLKKVA